MNKEPWSDTLIDKTADIGSAPRSFQREVACEPMPTTIRVNQKKGELGFVLNHSELVALKVLWSTQNYEIRAGQTVWVRGEDSKQSWAKQTVKKGELTVCLVPFERVVAVE
jgi:hypothetical protein